MAGLMGANNFTCSNEWMLFLDGILPKWTSRNLYDAVALDDTVVGFSFNFKAAPDHVSSPI